MDKVDIRLRKYFKYLTKDDAITQAPSMNHDLDKLLTETAAAQKNL